ncbi:uncharacterized protein PHACADRAFT_261606 [Phanerochaete carnosa HHB-10118-sp]|uniref:Uncharacterized protein n=1 Tax=Phanerochaete carnosa (strain HHB-10118-sp) TaxID=650164 RepID=K5VN96_PHACS|nr:uncharacterized protein PHACADRAFT_261606 [Phanerochaete carnosa HHB-10118-sp]EKM52913.1 hypothetical protein PHACADRAFT_261606 [Phanerochaete carnosa HHB-10118-sp]
MSNEKNVNRGLRRGLLYGFIAFIVLCCLLALGLGLGIGLKNHTHPTLGESFIAEPSATAIGTPIRRSAKWLLQS